MSPEELQALRQRHATLSNAIAKLKKVIDPKKKTVRAGVSFTLEDTINNVPRREDIIFSFFTTNEIPKELIAASKIWYENLVAKRLQVWAELNTAGVQV